MKSRQGACRDLRTEMVNTFDGSPISAFAYAYDAAGRRTERVDSGLTTNLFGYNMRSELADAIMGTNLYAYVYDPIGNRQLASVNEVTNLYQANELNQYTNINEGAVEPVYDPDGNLSQLGPWAYDWDGENRLISVASNGVPVVQNQYDYMSRRIMKATATQTNTFLYDGWNLIQERKANTSYSYVWGLDLSETLQGAGGVGGLLAMLSPDSCLLTPAYDANGNITDLVDTNGVVVAHYEYDPYGNTIAQSGDQADANPFRFSSKYWDGETGFYYYGYRYYSLELGRFISRDPLAQVNPRVEYRFVNNGVQNAWDYLGLMTVAGCQRSADRFMRNPGRYSLALQKVISAMDEITGCSPYPPLCECCTGDMADSWGYRDSQRGAVVICSNNMDADGQSSSTQKILETLVHENIHRLQECRQQEEQSCDGAVCTEIQAALNDGTCQRLSPGNVRQCVINSAASSAQERCDDDFGRARQRAEELYDRCNVPIEDVPTP